jgi:arylsulfatase
VCPYPGPSFTEGAELGYFFGDPISIESLQERDRQGWELYRVTEDASERHDVAGEHPEILQELIALWYVEAGKYNVLPITGPDQMRFAADRPQLSSDRDRYVYYPGTQTVPESAAVKVLNRSHVIAALVDIPDNGAEGVLLSHGGSAGGYVLYVQGGRLHYVHNYVGSEQFHLVSEEPVPTGRAVLSYQFEVTGPPDLRVGKGTPGTGTLFINEQPVGSMELPYTMPITISIDEGLTCGQDTGSPASDLYTAPFPFTGKLHRVVVDVTGERLQDHEAEIRIALARQ